MAEPDMRQRVEVSDDDRTVATAEVTTSEGSGGTARVSLRAEPGHITPGRRASLVDAVLDLPEVQQSARVEAAFRLGDGESLRRLQERCEDVSTRPAGWSALVDANLPSSRAGQHVPGLSRPGTPAGRITTSEAIVPSDSPAAAGPARNRPAHRSAAPPDPPPSPAPAPPADLVRLPGSNPGLLAFTQPAKRTIQTIFLQKSRVHFRWQNSHRSSKTAQVLGLQRHGRAQGTLGLFKSEIPRATRRPPDRTQRARRLRSRAAVGTSAPLVLLIVRQPAHYERVTCVAREVQSPR